VFEHNLGTDYNSVIPSEVVESDAKKVNGMLITKTLGRTSKGTAHKLTSAAALPSLLDVDFLA
jgi:hypothetical protein